MPRSHTHLGWVLGRLIIALFLGCQIAPSILRAEIRDVQEEIKKESEANHARRLLNGQAPPKHGWRGQQQITPAREEPGGTGYGYYFNADALIWTNSTIADYYV